MTQAEPTAAVQAEGAVSHSSVNAPSLTPGAQAPTYFWLNTGWGVLVALWVMDFRTYWATIPILPLLAATYWWLWKDARWSFPGQSRRVRKRLPWLLVLMMPSMFSVLLGPLGLVEAVPARLQWMALFQNCMLVVSLILPLVALPFMRHARRFTVLIGVASFIPTLLAISASLLIISPGS